MDNLKIVYKTVQSLTPYAKNARTHSEQQINAIAASIQEFGFVSPVLVDASGNIIAGHGRVMAANQIGMAKVPTVVISHLSERQQKALILADNKIASMSGWDMETLASELSDLVGMEFDLELTGFDEQELDSLLKSDMGVLPDFVVKPSEPQTQAPASNKLPVGNFEDQGIGYKQQYGVTVVCGDEKEQA